MSHARSALATLPLSFKDPARVAIVDGDLSWPTEVLRAVESGATGVVVVHPQPAEFAELLTTSAAVVIDSRWASNPAIGTAAQAFRAGAGGGSRLECRVILESGHDLAGALLDQVSLIRALLSPPTQLRIHHRSDRAMYAEGTTETAVTIDFSAVCTTAVPASATVRLLTTDGSVELLIPSGDTAQPARLTVVGPDGAVLAPTHYENGHRASLRRLRDTAVADRPADLQHLHADVLVVTAALRDHSAAEASA